jgi:AraC-like DNA-binding protein
VNVNYIDTDNGVAGFSQKNYSLKRHAHFPIEVAFALSGQLHIETDNGQYGDIQSAIIRSNVPHTFSCLNGECQLYFIDPTSDAGRDVANRYLGAKEMVLIDETDPERFREKHLHPSGKQRPGTTEMDGRVERCLDWIKANFASEGLNVSVLAEVVFLSESRLAHLFRQQVGISIHQYILWKKVEMAVKRAMEGFSLTDCAYDSGFADSSHFVKTFQKMFGTYPSFAVKK